MRIYLHFYRFLIFLPDIHELAKLNVLACEEAV